MNEWMINDTPAKKKNWLLGDMYTNENKELFNDDQI